MAVITRPRVPFPVELDMQWLACRLNFGEEGLCPWPVFCGEVGALGYSFVRSELEYQVQ
jgi:hypothetical protein